MSLNDDAVKDLESEIVKTPGSEPGENPKEGVISVEVSDEATDETPEAREALNHLEENEVLLQTTHEGVKRVHQMEEVVETVLAEESISRSRAKAIALVFEEFSQAVAKPIEFTEVPTATNLKETRAFVTTKLASEKEKLALNFTDYLKSTQSSIKCIVGEVKERLLPETLAILDTLRQEALEDLSKAATSKAFYLYRSNNEMVDLRKRLIDLPCELSEFHTSGHHLLPDRALVEALHCELSKQYVQDLFYVSSLQINDPRRTLHLFNREGEYTCVSYLGLLTFYANGGMLEVFTNLGAFYSEEGERVLSLLQRDLPEGASYTFDEVKKEISNLSSFVGEITLFYCVLVTTRAFFMLSSELMAHHRKQL